MPTFPQTRPKRLIGWLQVALVGLLLAMLGWKILSNARTIEKTIQHFVENGTKTEVRINVCLSGRRQRTVCYGTDSTQFGIFVHFGSCNLNDLKALQKVPSTPAFLTNEHEALPVKCSRPPTGRTRFGQFFIGLGGLLIILGIWGYFRDVPKQPSQQA
ncbi:MAG: hypothetical protein ABL898_17810 [Hyphomicrobiaceae bacterium]